MKTQFEEAVKWEVDERMEQIEQRLAEQRAERLAEERLNAQATNPGQRAEQPAISHCGLLENIPWRIFPI